jgi:hypothetical protein
VSWFVDFFFHLFFVSAVGVDAEYAEDGFEWGLCGGVGAEDDALCACGGADAWMQGMMRRVRAFTRLMCTRHTKDGGVDGFWSRYHSHSMRRSTVCHCAKHGVRVVSPPLLLFLPKIQSNIILTNLTAQREREPNSSSSATGPTSLNSSGSARRLFIRQLTGRRLGGGGGCRRYDVRSAFEFLSIRCLEFIWISISIGDGFVVDRRGTDAGAVEFCGGVRL